MRRFSLLIATTLLALGLGAGTVQAREPAPTIVGEAIAISRTPLSSRGLGETLAT